MNQSHTHIIELHIIEQSLINIYYLFVYYHAHRIICRNKSIICEYYDSTLSVLISSGLISTKSSSCSLLFASAVVTGELIDCVGVTG